MLLILISLIILTNTDFTNSQARISHKDKVSVCGKYTHGLTDGDYSEIYIFRSNKTCNVSFQFRFQRLQFLKYMLIFTGERVSTPLHSLDYLKVVCGDPPDDYTCAAMSQRATAVEDIKRLGVRVNFVNEYASALHLRFLKHVDVVRLTEIELYGRESNDIIHRGCFTDVARDKSSNYDGIMNCRMDCRQSSFGISKPLGNCFCLNGINFENEVSLSKCDVNCDDNTGYTCGGTDSYSVYIRQHHLPAFSGCHNKESFLADARSRGEVNLDVSIRNLTFSKCVRYCGLRHSFFLNGKCGCAEYVTTKILDHTLLCDIPCEFNASYLCGGKSGISLYRNCYVDRAIPCDKLLNCKKAVFDHNGECTHGCKSGFEGKSCITKTSDSSSYEPDEPDEEIEMITIATTTTTTTTNGTTDAGTDESVVQSKSVRVMANYIFSTWIGAAFLLILF